MSVALRHRVLRRLPVALAGSLAAALAGAEAAQAHAGLAQRENLPIPEWLFAAAAGVVLAVSFVALAVLWPEPKLERPRFRPLPSPLDRLGGRTARIVCGAIGVFLLALTLATALGGPDDADDNFASPFVFIIFWVGLVFASILLGNVFAAFNPWLALGRAMERLAGRTEPPRAYPERLGYWPAVGGLVAFAWMELAFAYGTEPRRLAVAVVVYTVITLAAMARYGARTWAERGETFGVYFTLVSRVAPFEARDGRAGLRPPLSGLTRVQPQAGLVPLLAVMIGMTTYDGFEQGRIWRENVLPDLTSFFESLGASFTAAETLAATTGLAAGILAVAAFYALGIAGARTVKGSPGASRLRSGFVHSLVPIAVVYVIAHYLTYLVFDGQRISWTASDPFGQGWDLFGTADAGIDYSVLSQNATWYLQVGAVVAGHVAALMLAHDRALSVYREGRLAVRSQYWMLLIMIGFTMLALWLLASANK
ncbi:MAG TPA: fenitrothion hydrolase [Solirubrobacteraceae bacterium]|nr:fenitrothion hydrolase [Solirubrobacteraceae bacterium]